MNKEKNIKTKNKKSKKILKIIAIIILLIITFVAGMFTGIVFYNSPYCHERPSLDKPLIYIYPTKPTKVSVSVSNPEKLTATYPKYKDNWQVIAQPNGDLKEVEKSRKYYGLYWEGKDGYKTKFYDGFVVKKDDLIPFLENKLSILGLNEREVNEFIIYWLPILEQNEYSLIRFQTLEEINKNMKLNIKPKPETLIRVMM